MPIKDEKITKFLNNLSSDSPTPGGGTTAALTGATAAALVEMVANLTIGKKGYEGEEKLMKNLLSQAREIRKKLLKLADEDTEAFNLVMKAYRLPRDNKKRKTEIQKAIKKATEVPLETAALSKKVSDMAKQVAKRGNKNAFSDAQSAIHLSEAGVECALENVKINLSSITNPQLKKSIKEKLMELSSNS